MIIRDEWAPLFASTGAKKWLARKRRPMPNALFPRTDRVDPRRYDPSQFIMADDADLLRAKEEIFKEASSQFKPDVTPEGFCGPTAVPAEWNNLFNVSGVGMNPLPIPISNNDAFVKANGLINEIRPADRPFLNEIVRLFFGAAVPADLRLRRDGSTSFPYFTTDQKYKKVAALAALHRADEFLDLMTGGKEQLQLGLHRFGACLVSAIHERQQANAILIDDKGNRSSKGRTAPTEEEARTGDYTGKTFADMTARDRNGNVIEGNFAMRRRDVFGMNGVVNYFGTAVTGCCRAVYLERFAFTYKVRTDLDKAARAAKFKYIVGADVKTMDKLIIRAFMTAVMEELEKYFDSRFVELMRRAYQAPYVVPSPWADDTPPDYDPCFGSGFDDPNGFTQHPGLPSGVWFNPDWGKLWMTFVYMILYRDVGAIHSPADIEALLQGRNPQHGLLDMSDDATFMTNDSRVAKALRNPSSPYARLEVEVPVIYLGGVFARTHRGIEVFPNPLTYVVNAFCREDSIARKDPVLVAQGHLARAQVYGRTPIFRDLTALVNSALRQHCGVNPDLIARRLAPMTRMSEIDAMVRENPAVLHYKVDPADVSPGLLDELTMTIPHADFFPKIRHLFKSTVH